MIYYEIIHKAATWKTWLRKNLTIYDTLCCLENLEYLTTTIPKYRKSIRTHSSVHSIFSLFPFFHLESFIRAKITHQSTARIHLRAFSSLFLPQKSQTTWKKYQHQAHEEKEYSELAFPSRALLPPPPTPVRERVSTRGARLSIINTSICWYI